MKIRRKRRKKRKKKKWRDTSTCFQMNRNCFRTRAAASRKSRFPACCWADGSGPAVRTGFFPVKDADRRRVRPPPRTPLARRSPARSWRCPPCQEERESTYWPPCMQRAEGTLKRLYLLPWMNEGTATEESRAFASKIKLTSLKWLQLCKWRRTLKRHELPEGVWLLFRVLGRFARKFRSILFVDSCWLSPSCVQHSSICIFYFIYKIRLSLLGIAIQLKGQWPTIHIGHVGPIESEKKYSLCLV